MLLFVRASLLIRGDWVVASLRRLLLGSAEVVGVLATVRYALVRIAIVVVFPLRHAVARGRVVELPLLMGREVFVPLRNETGSGVRLRSDVRRIEMHYYKW